VLSYSFDTLLHFILCRAGVAMLTILMIPSLSGAAAPDRPDPGSCRSRTAQKADSSGAGMAVSGKNPEIAAIATKRYYPGATENGRLT